MRSRASGWPGGEDEHGVSQLAARMARRWIEAKRSPGNSRFFTSVRRTRAVGLTRGDPRREPSCRGASKLKLAAPTASCLAPATDSWPL